MSFEGAGARDGALGSPDVDAPDDRPPNWRRALCLGLMVPLGWGALRLAAGYPGWVETIFSQGVFPPVRGVLGGLTGLIPLSVAEVLLLLLGLLLIKGGWRTWNAWWRRRRSLSNLCQHGIVRLLSTAGLVYLAFLLCWGFNHSRQPYAHHIGLEADPVEQHELEAVLGWLVQECNELREQIEEVDLRLVPASNGVDARIALAYDSLGADVPVLSGGAPLVRQAWFSPLLSLLGISGIYSPFTAESHVNDRISPIMLAFSTAHEIAHYKGFAREDEANFIAWQVCRRSDDAAVRYSGTVIAMQFTTLALSRVDSLRAQEIRESLSPRVLGDLEANRRFWRAKHTIVTEVAKASNDVYLKSQGQRQGRQSYGRMVDLIVAEQRVEGLR